MNKIYKVIFNRNKNRYEIVSELASSRGGKCKVKAGKQIAKLFMTGLLATFLSSVALAAEQEVVVKYDDATGTIKIVKKEDESQVLASYAVGGNISSIDPNEGTYPTGTISLGKDSKVLQNNTIAIGTDAHAGDASGSVTQSDGKIAIGNKTVASGDRSIALGNQSTTNKGSYNIVQGNDSIGIGTSTSVFGYSGVSIGRRNIIGVPDPDLVNNRVLTTKSKTPDKKGVDKEAAPGGNSVIVGAYNVAYGSRSSIIGTYSRAMGNNSVAIGSGVQSLTDGAIAIGKGSGYEFEDGSRKKGREKEFYGRDWELPPEYKVLKQVLSNDINGDKPYKKSSSGREGKYKYEKGGSLPKYNNYGAGSSDPGGFIVEGENALGIGTYTQVRGNSAIGLATGEMTADLSEKDKSQYARDMRKIMDMEEVLYEAQEALQAGTGDTAALESAVKAAEERLATAKKDFRETYLKKYSFVDGNGALGVGRQILAQGDRSMAVGDYAKAISSDAIAYGGQTLANGTNSMAMGGNAHVGTIDTSFDNSMAIGSHTNVQAGNAVALGAFSQVTGTNSLALGFGTQSSTDSNNITYNSVSGHDSTLIGSYGNIAGNNSILIGSSGSIANDRVVGLGNNINIEAADQNDQENNTAGSVFLGDHAGYVKDSKRSRSLGQVDVVGSAGKMELTESLSSTKGALRDYTKDFIYIYMLERQDDGTQIGAPIAVRSDFAGGDSTVGVVSVGSTYEQQFNSLKDIQDYHSKVGSLITVPVDVTVQVTKNGVPLGEQQQTRYFAADSTRDTIYADNTLSEEDKAKVWDTIQKSISSSNTTYTVFETRRIQNVAPGLIGLNSTDAINGSQLFATNQMLGNLVGSLKKTFGDNVTITEDGQIKVSGGTLGWIAKAKAADGSNGTVNYQVGKDDKIAEDDLEKKGSAIEAADQLVFQAGKNIGLVQTPDTLTISTIDTPSFKSVELRGDEKTVDGKKVTEVTKIDSNGMKVVTETSTPASDGSTTPTVTEKVSTTVGKDGVSTDGSVKVTNGTTDLVTIDKGTDGSGTDKEYGKIGLDGKNGSNATITVDRGTSSLDNTKNIGTDPKQDISENNPAKMDRITYTTKDKNDKDVITHEVATMDDGLFFSGDSADGENNNVKNKFDRKLSQETKIIGGVNLGLTDSASAEERQKAIADKLTDGNIGVISDGTDTLTVKLAKNLMGLDSTTYTSPTTKTDDGDDATSTMKVDGNGVRFVDNNGDTVNNTPTFTTDGITGGNKQITNVGSGFKNGTTSVTIDDIKNPSDALKNSNVWNNAVNVGDLKNIIDTGFKLNTSGQPTKPDASTVKIGDTINIIDGANTKVSAIDDSTTGTHTFHIDVTGMPISYTDGEGNALTKIGDKYYKNTDIKNGKPKTDATEVPADKVTNNIKVINKDGTTNNQGTISNVKSVFDSNIGNGADTGSNVDEIKDGSVISNTGSNQFINDLTKLNDQVDPNATDAEAEKIRAKKDEEKLNSVSTVRDLQKVALTPLFFEGDVAQDAQTANTFGRKLSEKTKIVGGQKDVNQLTDNNIGVVSNGT
ncbi:ESPR-type extended signal peptide-containing protein, partial [Gallibacterium anatis]|uniref:ESPR-type extended signal peptide-containing protein n=1 Tax=Gallibacterium anatis TaxID=750 RepID=UPI003007355A